MCTTDTSVYLKKCSIVRSVTTILIIATCIVLLKKFTLTSDSTICIEESRVVKHKSTPNDKDAFLHKISHFQVSYSFPGLELYIYTAFLDERYNKNVLRIFALEEKGGVTVDFKCKFTIETGKLAKEVIAKRYWIDESWPDWSPYFASEYNCAVPKISGFNTIIFFSTDGKYVFNLPVEKPRQYRIPKRNDLAVCIKPLSGYQSTDKMVEWVETLKAVGYKNIIVYQSDLTGPGRHVLEYYEQNGLITVIDFPYLLSTIQHVEKPGLTDQKRFATYQQIYLIAMHDCLYRFSSLYRYIAFQDIDEIIAPLKPESISTMLRNAEKTYPDAAGFLFKTAWHWEDFGESNKTETLYMIKYGKSTSPTDNQPKSIVSTDRTLTINFHNILDVPKKHFKSIHLPPIYGMVHHFRGKCQSKFSEEICKKMLSDVNSYNVFNRYKGIVNKQVFLIKNHLRLK